MSYQEWIFTAMLGIFSVAVLFWALRSLALWYWKINDVVKGQSETNELLTEIRDLLKEKSQD